MTSTDKILEEFDDLPIFSVPIIEGVASVRTFVVDVQIVKAFLATKINQAIAEERARLVGEIKHEIFCAYGIHSFLTNINDTQYLNEDMLFQILSSLDTKQNK